MWVSSIHWKMKITCVLKSKSYYIALLIISKRFRQLKDYQGSLFHHCIVKKQKNIPITSLSYTNMIYFKVKELCTSSSHNNLYTHFCPVVISLLLWITERVKKLSFLKNEKAQKGCCFVAKFEGILFQACRIALKYYLCLLTECDKIHNSYGTLKTKGSSYLYYLMSSERTTTKGDSLLRTLSIGKANQFIHSQHLEYYSWSLFNS